MATRRERIEILLRQRDWTPKQLAECLGVTMEDIIEDLEHVRRSTQKPAVFRFVPPKCRSCGFVFRERARIKPPSKCPGCKKEGIEEGRYFITGDNDGNN